MRYCRDMASVVTIPRAELAHLTPGPDLRELAAGWLLGYRSENTRRAYRLDLATWVDWIRDRGVDPMAARRAHLDAWARDQETQGRRPTTVARGLASVSSFYRWCVAEGHLDANPAADVRRPPTTEGYVDLTPALDRDQVGRLIAAADSPQDHALVVVLAAMGLRVSEALALRLEAVQDVRGHRTVVVHGKGGRQDRMPLPPVVMDALERVAAAEGRTTGPVFVGADGAPMTRHGATRILARLSRRAGFPSPVRPHTLRATAITSALEAGSSLRDVQDMARHADPRTTRRYDRARGALDRHAAYTVATWLPLERADDPTMATTGVAS